MLRLSALFAVFLSAPATAQQATSSSLYLENCAICHGDGAAGPTNPDFQGSILVGNAFVKKQTDPQLIDFLKKGRPADAPDSTMHVLMPAFDFLAEEGLKLLVQFLRRVAAEKNHG